MLARIVCLAALLTFAISANAQSKPNVILFLIDDMGWKDVGCYGSKYYETPAIDKLAAEGMRFTQGYAACCVCSPTRAAILTGKSPARTGITDWIPGQRPKGKMLNGPAIPNELALDHVTIAEALKADGYTTASIGKWHLGGPAFYPDKNGFDFNIGGNAKGSPPSYHAPFKIDSLQPEGEAGEYLTDRLTTEAEKFIDAHKDKPFFIYFPHYSVHTPIQPKKDLEARYAAKTPTDGQNNPAYAALVQSTDESVGRVMKKLDELKLAEKTIVIFTSDNGGLSMRGQRGLGPTNNEPLRGGKGSPWEGGVRVPLIVRWPGVIKPGTTDATPVISYDFFDTLIDLTGSKSAKAKSDGESLAPLLKQTGILKRDTIYWHYPHYHPGGATPNSSIRHGDWKLVKFYEDNHVELYNLKDDPYEKTDLAKANPEQTAKLQGMLDAYLKETGAKFPTANPEYRP